ncbi:hypothetical protein [Egbenema bharatensis]|uniref:hypothetical protein n=1 Tax=Egbenema bharatensis TaxID=3463334 RepID=UPI003A869646
MTTTDSHVRNHQWLQKLTKYLDRLECAMIRFFTTDHEPKISYRIRRNGQERWIITDPDSHQRIVCTSESEVRFWLDQRYNVH